MFRYVVALLIAGCSFQHGLAGDEPGDASDGDPIDATPADVQRLDASDPVTTDAAIDAPPAVTVRQDCLDWYQHGVTTSGVQMIDPDGNGPGAPFNAYCDMETAGGGWTLVWVYGFTDYASFDSVANSVTPRPTWGGGPGTPTSTTIPTAPTTPGALEFAKWPSLGASFLFESNINQWLSCTPGVGSLVTGTSGSISCTVVKVITSTCTTTVPDRLGTYGSERGLWAGASVYATYDFWEGSATASWPTHDPCGANGTDQKQGAANPYGSIYLRR